MKNETKEYYLLNQIAEGNELAFCELYNRYVQFVYAAAFRLLKDESSAEDVVQETFLKVWIYREKLPQVSNFPAYLHVLIRNHIYNKFRRMAYEEIHMLSVMSKQQAHGKITLDTVYYNELKRSLKNAVSQLPPQQQKAYLLSREEGLSHREVAIQMNISAETVKKHIGEALKFLRKSLRHFGSVMMLGIYARDLF